MVDMYTIGAGGGSIARLDPRGWLLVGPESAGAEPGPACYGKGGDVPTVTDANLVPGRLRPEAFLGGRMELDVAAAERVVGRLASPWNWMPWRRPWASCGSPTSTWYGLCGSSRCDGGSTLGTTP